MEYKFKALIVWLILNGKAENRNALTEPFIILHEFYHHLRTAVDRKHKGTEKHASEFAKEFIEAYKSMAAKVLGNN